MIFPTLDLSKEEKAARRYSLLFILLTI